jgi:hypothetical protein
VSNYVKVNYLKKNYVKVNYHGKNLGRNRSSCPTLAATARVLHAQATVLPLLPTMVMGTHDLGIRRVKT